MKPTRILAASLIVLPLGLVGYLRVQGQITGDPLLSSEQLLLFQARPPVPG